MALSISALAHLVCVSGETTYLPATG